MPLSNKQIKTISTKSKILFSGFITNICNYKFPFQFSVIFMELYLKPFLFEDGNI